ncbi:unnamed protein product [Chondrus crispus]|uniref:Uncharacterized protein n=1 Tax=Chondrus crispus TaxID=2769 RepID=R7QFI5_CHOCR|nr:unnamed protein product [Chondrus crispus]CDF36849.1 unnamed protein product [Chondrus crispus]|eukprot:XP_005716668.1 unnamed protein product [Chondrus crispus]
MYHPIPLITLMLSNNDACSNVAFSNEAPSNEAPSNK